MTLQWPQGREREEGDLPVVAGPKEEGMPTGIISPFLSRAVCRLSFRSLTHSELDDRKVERSLKLQLATTSLEKNKLALAAEEKRTKQQQS
ncbi:hypothetical protein NDU88_004822 [Pleurodeles waltl]|uniref:Uncharacterized protein n=1 Tax=Pleurodeles waltl TaxID=8319 RepID=A0AAV7QGL9_PLEWA|nr:hypothetical protein NDU88_004822 [Pleurodeles waltl]